jgi:hypothetical protein
MYAIFQQNECTKVKTMAVDYENRQDSMFFNRIDAMPTYMRCFKNTDLEQKMRTDSYKTRIYSDWDCRLCQNEEVVTGQSNIIDSSRPLMESNIIDSSRPLMAVQTRRC